jgi:Magnesium chelatase, subunit ChlI C-terminal
VGLARERQQARLRSDKKISCNARMSPRQIKQHCKLSDESQELIRVAVTKLNLSARAYDRILKVSRTVADLQSSDDITTKLSIVRACCRNGTQGCALCGHRTFCLVRWIQRSKNSADRTDCKLHVCVPSWAIHPLNC